MEEGNWDVDVVQCSALSCVPSGNVGHMWVEVQYDRFVCWGVGVEDVAEEVFGRGFACCAKCLCYLTMCMGLEVAEDNAHMSNNTCLSTSSLEDIVLANFSQLLLPFYYF